jgi:hypothetical protein
MATPRTRELAVYDGQDCIGTIKVDEDERRAPSIPAASVAAPSRL